jgi:transcriptional regulator with XRE-family HTH domain
MSDNHENFKQKLGQMIELRRESMNYGVREFARIAQIEHHQLINIEKGRVDVRLSTLIKIAAGLGTEVKQLIDF